MLHECVRAIHNKKESGIVGFEKGGAYFYSHEIKQLEEISCLTF